MRLDTGRNNWVVIGAGIVLLVVAGAAVAAFTRGGSTPGRSAPSATAVAFDSNEVNVDVVDNKYEPPVIRIRAGTTVTWLFKGTLPHTVTLDGDGAEVDSGTKTKGDFAHTFEAVGIYDYRCRVHPTMTGRVVVE